MFLKAICDDEPCMVNTDFIIEVYDLGEIRVRAYTMDINYPYMILRSDWEDFIDETNKD